jgi:ABC-type microcin C transport system permease subunit YejB
MFFTTVDWFPCSGVYCYTTLSVSSVRAIIDYTLLHFYVLSLLEVLCQFILVSVLLSNLLLKRVDCIPS